MNANPKKRGALVENSVCSASVTMLMVQERARELAVINGRPSHDVSDSEWEQAWQELTASVHRVNTP